MSFVCNVCSHTEFSNHVVRGDGHRILFCGACGMGIIEDPPESTADFYTDSYYGQTDAEGIGYANYAFTAEHSLLWPRLMVEELTPNGGKVLDVGCADGFLLERLSGSYQRYGIEANNTAAKMAADKGITIITDDICDPIVDSRTLGEFDVITSIATFEHVLNLRASVEKCIHLLSRRGVMIFEIPLVSDHRDNSDWFNSSYEHIHYPTLNGMNRLFASFSNVHFVGFESDIKGYGSTYIGACAKDPEVFAQLRRLFDATTQADLQELGTSETRLNLAYHVVHCFRPTPARVAALPMLLDIAATTNLAKRLTQLWYADSVAATNAEIFEASSRWHETQAKNWEDAYRTTVKSWETAYRELEKQIK